MTPPTLQTQRLTLRHMADAWAGGLPPGLGGLPRGITLPAGLSGLMKKK
jgi:signal recognition particle subunit SRP54